MTQPVDNLREHAIRSLGWAIAQSWGGKIIGFLLFVVLARLVTPAEFGVVSAAVLMFFFMGVIAGFGFDEALVQRPVLEDRDINLPFYVSVILSIALAIFAALKADAIASLLEVPGSASIVAAIALLTPIATITLFQDTIYRRHMMFKTLALRMLYGNVLAGVLACIFAFAGAGAWALVIQVYVANYIGLVWIWWRPLWKPSFAFVPSSFRSLAKFGVCISGRRILDFIAVRSADFIILLLFGPVSLGIYSAGARLYQTLMMLLQSIISEVALTVLAKIAHDRERIASLYLKTTTASIALMSPVFVASAAVAPEICDVLFGPKWVGIEHIVRPFLLLGAVQCVQNLNSAYYSAMGRPAFLIHFNILRIAAALIVFWCCRDSDIMTFVDYFCLAQTVATLPNFFFICGILGISFWRMVRQFAPFILCSMTSFAAVMILRQEAIYALSMPLLRGALLATIYAAIYGFFVLLFARRDALWVFEFLGKRRIVVE